jgi:hypothetical protein
LILLSQAAWRLNNGRRNINNTVKVAIIVLVFIALIVPAFSQTTSGTEKSAGPCFRAAEGDTMWVIINRIKADKCGQFEKLIDEVCWPIFETSNALDQLAAQHARFLYPVKMNDDSTFVYIFIMDPVIRGVDYQFGSVLRRKYDEPETDQYLKQIMECFASPQIMFPVIQSRH